MKYFLFITSKQFWGRNRFLWVNCLTNFLTNLRVNNCHKNDLLCLVFCFLQLIAWWRVSWNHIIFMFQPSKRSKWNSSEETDFASKTWSDFNDYMWQMPIFWFLKSRSKVVVDRIIISAKMFRSPLFYKQSYHKILLTNNKIRVMNLMLLLIKWLCLRHKFIEIYGSYYCHHSTTPIINIIEKYITLRYCNWNDVFTSVNLITF